MSTQEVKLLATEVEDGQTIRFTCPYCMGGNGSERSLTITRDGDGVVYNCFRANCSLGGGAYGGTGASLVRTNLDTLPRKRKRTPYEGSLAPLSDEWIEYLSDTIGITDEHRDRARPVYAPEEHRVAWPILGPMGRRRGWVLRSYSLGVEPKAMTRMDEDEPCTSFYQTKNSSKYCVVVEDIPSAVRASAYLNAVSMNGSGLGPDAVAEIAAHHRKVVWAFDEDATLKACKHHTKYALYFEDSWVLPLTKDLKNMTEAELKETLEGIT